MSIHSLIRNGRARLGLTEQQFAEKVGVTRGAVQQWEKEGGTAPRRANQPAVAELLGITVAELMAGGSENVRKHDGGKMFPLISWVEAGLLNDINDPFYPNEADEWVEASESNPTDGSFALVVHGPSMTNPDPDAKYSFPDGTVIFVDPNKACDPGNFVVAKDVETQKATFKQLVTDGGRWYLRPLNPQFKTVEIDNPKLRLIGRVVEYQKRGKL